MTPKANQEPITADGEYSLYQDLPGRRVLLEWEVTAGSATVTPGIVTMSGAFMPVLNVDGSDPVFAAAGGFCELAIPSSGMLALKVESASGLTLKHSQTRIQL